MGILTEMRETAAKRHDQVVSLIAEDKERSAVLFRENTIKRGARLFDETYNRYRGLGEMLESNDTREQYKAALTLEMLAKVENYIENAKQMYGEATVQGSLGALTPRVLDVVRIFYPNQILTTLADVQPLDGAVGSIFVLKPRFSNSLPANTVGPVSAGDQIFTGASYYYASEVVGQQIGTGNGSLVTFAGSLGKTPIRKGTISITSILASGSTPVVAVDDSNGNLTGTNVSTGTIDYTTGSVSVTFASAVANTTPVIASYQWDSEANGETGINEIEFDMSVIPVRAKIHPLKFKYSVAAGLAASAHLAVDVQDTLAELAGQFMKIERDNLGVKLIQDAAVDKGLTSSDPLYFDATPSTYYDRQSLYADIELKLNEAETQIQVANGRGGVSWILCGTNAANVFRNSKGFQPAPVVAPIGAHIIGYLRDGTVPVVKSLLVMDKDTFVVGYKGYMAPPFQRWLAHYLRGGAMYQRHAIVTL
jgi:Major capsid protein Gp23